MALMSLTTVGYGEVHPLSRSGQIVASALVFTRAIAVLVGIGASSISSWSWSSPTMQVGDILIATGERPNLMRLESQMKITLASV